ncbi:MFS transporter [Algivirga pacifica]|uniref:MFS transporter n=1 Tax=Algivirga pacifica TaxID=1162670 RepID=A0ABP9D0K6_9BACT
MKNDKQVVNAWCMYDWANSVYSLAISTAIFPIFYTATTGKLFKEGIVPFFGIEIENTVLLAYALSFSFLLIAGLSPLLSGIADAGGYKKQLLKFFVYLGSFSCTALFFFTGENVEWGILFSMLASIGFSGSLVFYNAYLPEIVTEDRYDVVSARGFALGYIGSVIHLVVSLILILKKDWFGIESDTLPSRIAFLSVGVWWFGFSQYTFAHLPNEQHEKDPSPVHKLFRKGYKEIHKVWRDAKDKPYIRIFLASFFFYSMGVQTVILLAASFGEKELKMDSAGLIGLIILLQVVAIGGAALFAFVSKKTSNKAALISMILIWIALCVSAYFVQDQLQFYIVGMSVGLVMGGIQSLSRSTFSKLIPEGSPDTTSYFSFYDVAEKLSIVIGTFAYGFIEQLTGNMRYSVLALGGLFIIGLLLMFFFRMPKTGVRHKKVTAEA